MERERPKSGAAISENSGPLASQCLFDFEPPQGQHCSKQSQDAPVSKERSARPPKSPTAHASGAPSLFLDEVRASSSKLPENVAGDTELPDFRVPVPRVSVARVKKQRISGLQRIIDAAETVSCSAFAIWQELHKRAYRRVDTTEAGGQVEFLLASVGRTELSRLISKDRKTVRLAIQELVNRHLITLHTPADTYKSRPEIYRLHDPFAAAERMRVENGISSWRQRGRGRVPQPPS